MKAYILKRILSVIPVLLVVAVVVFFIIHLTPGDPAAVILGPEATQQDVEQLRENLGLNLPIYEQFVTWFFNVLRGDLGWSIYMNKPVLNAFFDQLGPTFSLAILSQAIAILIAIPMGIIAASRRGTYLDRLVMSFSLFGVSVPNFLLALLLVLIFAVHFSLLPVAGYQPLSTGVFEHVRYLILPAIALGAIQAALISRVTRSSMLEVLHSNYVKTAVAKGAKEWVVVIKHALKNAFIPILTVIGQTFGQLIAGAVVIETVFNIPGIGQLIINAITRRDFEVVQGSILLIATFYVVINLVVDLMYGLIDPRVRLNRK
ncbi:dipeptide transport system permease protein DppB [Geomicrobium sp. JCM 19037]|uniref:ABC transporter permease n=1 Tax=Geomicrobium sp. JCM 19037 TaxID=1460634 RepID=UPI00045F414E|nr:ABC transporter permease [Geomicrobium sp. JCM 19037]GAK04925.1 dipeptide transport system permease protein DppB [Geomicrobium sp. JCM 19037]